MTNVNLKMKYLKTFQKIKKIELKNSKLDGFDCSDCFLLGRNYYKIKLLTKKLSKQLTKAQIYKQVFLAQSYTIQDTISKMYSIDESKLILLDSSLHPFNPFYFENDTKIFFNLKISQK